MRLTTSKATSATHYTTSGLNVTAGRPWTNNCEAQEIWLVLKVIQHVACCIRSAVVCDIYFSFVAYSHFDKMVVMCFSGESVTMKPKDKSMVCIITSSCLNCYTLLSSWINKSFIVSVYACNVLNVQILQVSCFLPFSKNEGNRIWNNPVSMSDGLSSVLVTNDDDSIRMLMLVCECDSSL